MNERKVLSLTSPQRRELFSREFKKALDRANTTVPQLAKDLGLKYDRVRYWYTGRSFPSIHVIRQISDFLGDDEIGRVGVAVSTVRCACCKKNFVRESSQGESYLCSAECRTQSERLRTKMGKSSIGQQELQTPNLYLAAVTKFCRGCEPIGICKTPTCALRPVSPLPLFSKAEASKEVTSKWDIKRIESAREKISLQQESMQAGRRLGHKIRGADKGK